MSRFNYNNLQYVNFGGELLTVGIGTKYYCSPEQEKSENYDNKTDIYSLGIIIFEMFIAVLQAFIYTVLSCIYLGDALRSH